MRISKKRVHGIQEGDLTPMIDMTFQLIAFFMVLINFSQAEQNLAIQLPESELAKPPDEPFDYPITLNLKQDGMVVIGGQPVSIEGLKPYLVKEKNVLQLQGKPLSDATVIIRSHKDTPFGQVQQLIKSSQQEGFETFALRAKEDVT